MARAKRFEILPILCAFFYRVSIVHVDIVSYLPPSNENRSSPWFYSGTLPLLKLDPLANEPTSLHWRFGGLWVGRAPQRDGGMGAAFERRLAYMHIYTLDESTGSPADI